MPRSSRLGDHGDGLTAAAHPAERVVESAHAVAKAVKPHLRGWMHAGVFPLVTAAVIVLVVLAPTTPGRISSAVFGVTACLLFGTSALYHRGTWSPKAQILLKRFDHSNIFLIIAGSYTPLTVMLLPRDEAVLLLSMVWGGAILGVLFRVFWVGAPRWLYTPAYILLGWAAVFYLPEFLRNGGPVVLSLIIIGGVLYTLGGVVYAMKWPNPSPRWFGFHEIFHAFTVAAFVVHYIAISMAVYAGVPG